MTAAARRHPGARLSVALKPQGCGRCRVGVTGWKVSALSGLLSGIWRRMQSVHVRCHSDIWRRKSSPSRSARLRGVFGLLLICVWQATHVSRHATSTSTAWLLVRQRSGAVCNGPAGT